VSRDRRNCLHRSYSHLRIAGALAIALIGGTLSAAPVISIDSPPPGNLYDLRPTIRISYSSDSDVSPVDPNSLLVTVNGVNWTGKFTITANGAVYAVTTQDQLIAGDLTITASIWDTAQPPVQATDTNTYAVFPTLETILPGTGREGTPLTLTVQGLDPDPTEQGHLPRRFHS
jgi:hypothetical protein